MWSPNLYYEINQFPFNFSNIFRSFANETSQFLAPYDQSVNKTNIGAESPNSLTQNQYTSGSGLFPIEQNAQNARLNVQSMSASVSNSELSSNTATASGSLEGRIDMASWNPFEEQPFSQMSEDHIFDAEFDKIRQRGSQGSMLTPFTHHSWACCTNSSSFQRYYRKINIYHFNYHAYWHY